MSKFTLAAEVLAAEARRLQSLNSAADALRELGSLEAYATELQTTIAARKAQCTEGEDVLARTLAEAAKAHLQAEELVNEARAEAATIRQAATDEAATIASTAQERAKTIEASARAQAAEIERTAAARQTDASQRLADTELMVQQREEELRKAADELADVQQRLTQARSAVVAILSPEGSAP